MSLAPPPPLLALERSRLASSEGMLRKPKACAFAFVASWQRCAPSSNSTISSALAVAARRRRSESAWWKAAASLASASSVKASLLLEKGARKRRRARASGTAEQSGMCETSTLRCPRRAASQRSSSYASPICDESDSTKRSCGGGAALPLLDEMRPRSEMRRETSLGGGGGEGWGGG